MRKLTALLGLMLLVATLPARAINLSLETANPSVGVGDSVGINLRVSGLGNRTAPSVGAFDLNILFDAAVIRLAAAPVFADPLLGNQLDVSGFGLDFQDAIDSGTGTLNLFQLSLDSAADLDTLQAADFILVQMTFAAQAAGTTALSIANGAILGDVSGNALQFTTQGLSITVTAVPEPTALLLFAVALIALTIPARQAQSAIAARRT